MHRKSITMVKGTLKVNESYEGETIEQKIERITTSREPIEDTAPVIYTDRKDGVMPEYNPRTDRFDVAIEAMDTAHRSSAAKTMEIHKNNINQDSAAESTNATNSEN